MNQRTILYWSITVALAGFLFGFDTVVISGADEALQQLWPRGAFFHGFVIMASALWGTVIGAIFGGIPTDVWGRKKTLIWIGVLYLVSAIGSALAQDPWMFAVFRFLGGLGIGVSTIAAPAYITEIAPANDRGKMVAMYQFNIVLGILVAFLSNFFLSGLGENAWRWMLGVQAFPALLYMLLVMGISESPRWLLIHKKDREGAANTLRRLHPDSNIDALLYELQSEGPNQRATKETIFDAKYRFPLTLAFLIAFFNQFSGINAFLYYAPRIFAMAGLEKSSALLSSVGVGLVNLAFTLIGVALIDRFGRKQLMYIGSVGYVVSLALITVLLYLESQGMKIPLLFFLFIASHAIGQGAVIWVFISEIFPTHLRASGQAFGSSVHWVLAAIIPALVPTMFERIGAAPVFGVFAFMMVLQLIFVWKMMPETKGVPLEDLEKQLLK